ncbi:hypothetical protein Tco_0526738 [Tanacetum coccineum]
MRNANPIRTLKDYSKPSHEVYRNTIELPVGNNVVPLRSDTIWLVQNRCSFHGLWLENPNQHLKDFLKLVDSLDLDDDDITLVSAAGDKVSTAGAATIISAATTTATTVDEITLAQALEELKSTKPKQKGVVIQELVSLDISRLATTLNRLERSIQIGTNIVTTAGTKVNVASESYYW